MGKYSQCANSLISQQAKNKSLKIYNIPKKETILAPRNSIKNEQTSIYEK
jgi:hypothetical protein